MTTNQIAQLIDNDSEFTFDYAIVDEASKCKLEDLIISLPSVKHLVLIGDYMQLDPFFDEYYKLPKEKKVELENIGINDLEWNELNMSPFSMLFSKILHNNLENNIDSFDDNPIVGTMKKQFRMNEKIFDLVSSVYKIHDGFEIVDEKKESANDLICFDINGSEIGSSEDSFYNIDEYIFIGQILDHIKNNRDKFKSIEKIGVITGYAKQRKEIDTYLRKNKIKIAEIGTIDRFQGKQYDLVIVSLVRTESLGFLKEVRRMNVAVSRAKSHLIVIGNFNELIKLQMNKKEYNEFNDLKKKEMSFVYNEFLPKLYNLREEIYDSDGRIERVDEFLKENEYE
jgi:serine/threonine-protein kinase